LTQTLTNNIQGCLFKLMPSKKNSSKSTSQSY